MSALGIRPWRPSNGTMGEIWMAEWCHRCANDTFDEETLEGDSCPILMTLLIGDLHSAVTALDGELSGTCSDYAAIDGEAGR